MTMRYEEDKEIENIQKKHDDWIKASKEGKKDTVTFNIGDKLCVAHLSKPNSSGVQIITGWEIYE